MNKNLKVKKIIKLGSSYGIIIDTNMLYKSELELGDLVTVDCSKNKIVIKKAVK